VAETTVEGVLRAAAGAVPDQVALIAGVADPGARRRWTYGELLAEAERVAGVLAARFEVGERIAVRAPNLPEWVIVEFGAALAGLVPVTVKPGLPSR
jgi:fatty-acyl-CoA synthase